MSIKDYLINRRKKKFHKKYKVGLCLSGGGTRGFAHMGAFKAFEECGIKFDAVAGSSAGSLFGAMYASGLTYEDMSKLTSDMKNSDFRHSKLGFLPSSMDRLKDSIKTILPIHKIEKMKIPFFAVAVDIKTGKEMEFSSGDASYIIAGSCAIPGVFLPVKYRNMTLIDGGTRNNIPANVLIENGCDFVVTIDCNSARGGGTSSSSIFAQFTTAMGIMMVNNSINGLKNSDIIICPDMKQFNSLKIKEKDAMIEEGYKATMDLMPEIQKMFLGKYVKRKK